MMKRIVKLFLIGCLPCLGHGEVEVKNVTANQHYPYDGLVDIVCEVSGVPEDLGLGFDFAATNLDENVEIPIQSVVCDGVGIESLRLTNGVYNFVWDARRDLGEVRINDVALVIKTKIPGVQLWENGPYWAECNIGASKPEEAGYYFWWGDTVGYKWTGRQWDAVDGSKKGYSFASDDCPTHKLDRSELESKGYIDSYWSVNLVEKYDAACQHFGGKWRMPTQSEFLTLSNKCTKTWITTNGVNGVLVKGKDSYKSKSIFLPASGCSSSRSPFFVHLDQAGYYYSATGVASSYVKDSYCFFFSSTSFYVSSGYRYSGYSIRAVASSISYKTKTTMSCAIDLRNPKPPVILPENGTVFETALNVAMTCESDGAVIRYTTDGSEPTMESAEFTSRFRVRGKTTVKAAAFYPNGNRSETTVAEYALGRCVEPVISLEDGAVFLHKDQEVSIAYEGEEGVVRYTLDGSEPTAESPVYAGPFTVSETTTVKAKVFSDRWFDSQTVTATLTRKWERVATPVITAAEFFTGSKTRVEISCATPGARIFYTLDGSWPLGGVESVVYAGPFDVTASCTVRAIAGLNDDWMAPTFTTWTITKVWGIGDSMGDPDREFTTSGDAGFVRAAGEGPSGGEAMRSENPGSATKDGEYKRAVLSTTVTGPGTVSFKWKTSCEEDEEFHEYDHAEFAVDGVVVRVRDGIKDWNEVSVKVEGAGEHTLMWSYLKDWFDMVPYENGGEDCLWVADFQWTPEPTDPVVNYINENGMRKSLTVERAWLTDAKRVAYLSGVMGLDVATASAEELAAKLTLRGANGIPLWQSFVAGLEPADAESRFMVALLPGEGGGFTLQTNPPPQEGRKYTVKGTDNLTKPEASWPEAELGDEKFVETNRFFKVRVEMK